MDGNIIGAIAGTGSAVAASFITMWRQSRDASRALGRVEGKMDGLTQAVNSRLETTEKRIDHLQGRFNGHLNEHAKGGGQ